MSLPDFEEFRYERKFVAEGTDAATVRRLVTRHPAMFSTAYPPRRVNALYLDTPMRAAYLDNAEGNPQRSKARIRWYGGLFGTAARPILEIKAKQGLVGGKLRYPMAAFSITDDTTWATLRPALCPAEGADPLPAIDGLSTVCAISYDREYYLSADERFRITVDSDVCYVAVGTVRPRWHHRVTERDRVVVELKYGPEADSDVHHVSSWFPFRLARNSKYARALEALAL